MTVDEKLSTVELLKLAADQHQKRVVLSEEDRAQLIALLKQRGADELEYGEEVVFENVRMVRRVNGAVGVYFS